MTLQHDKALLSDDLLVSWRDNWAKNMFEVAAAISGFASDD